MTPLRKGVPAVRSIRSPPPARSRGQADALTPGVTLGRYTVLGIVGKGAMGEVYAAYDPELDRKIAIKLLRVGAREDGAATEGRIRLMREAQAIAKLSHPNVVTVYDVGTFEDDVFIAMQFVDGHTLRYWVHAQPRAWSEVVKIVRRRRTRPGGGAREGSGPPRLQARQRDGRRRARAGHGLRPGARGAGSRSQAGGAAPAPPRRRVLARRLRVGVGRSRIRRASWGIPRRPRPGRPRQPRARR